MTLKYRKAIIAFYALLIPLSVIALMNIKFVFAFEQFFPQGDPDLIFFKEFIHEFESDDNFLLVGVESKNDNVFEKQFLDDFHKLCLESKRLPLVRNVQSLTTISTPIKTPFGYSAVPLIHRNSPDKYGQDKENILSDKRFKDILINGDASALVMNIKTIDFIGLEDSKALMKSLDSLVSKYDFKDVHYLGRPNFTKEMINIQKVEMTKSIAISGVLVIIILWLIYRSWISVGIAMGSISLSLLFFMALLSVTGRELNVMSALYPILMLIVGTSDVIHIMSKYIDELSRGKTKAQAIDKTIRQIGIATLLTSLTTAVGFATLLTSDVKTIGEFGINAAIGVVLAYVVVVTLTTSVLTYFDKEQLSKTKKSKSDFWEPWLEKWHHFTQENGNAILIVSAIIFAVFFIGISQISTDYRIEGNLPTKAKVTQDFQFFERELNGFRPMEMAITVTGDKKADSYEVLKEVSKLEDYLDKNPYVNSSFSLATAYKSIERANHGNNPAFYRFPDKKAFAKAKRLVNKLGKDQIGNLVNKDKSKTRISARLKDAGAETIKENGVIIDKWIEENIDASLIAVKRTGTGLIVDKNAEFIKKDLINGLLLALALVSLLMVMLFKNLKMLVIALIPNIFPVLFAASLLGFFNIPLDASVSIIFAIIFGIAVDDTIHFLSKYNLSRREGKSIEESLHITMIETGKAITFTTIILFFGFLVMLFSIHPPSFNIGLLISITLVGAWLCDLLILPVIIRKFLKE